MFEFTKQYSDKFSLKTIQNCHNVLCGLSETVGMSKSIKEREDQCIKTFAASLTNASATYPQAPSPENCSGNPRRKCGCAVLGTSLPSAQDLIYYQ